MVNEFSFTCCALRARVLICQRESKIGGTLPPIFVLICEPDRERRSLHAIARGILCIATWAMRTAVMRGSRWTSAARKPCVAGWMME